jgi:hypothetical protein
MARRLIAAMPRPGGEAAPLLAPVEKDLGEPLGVVVHARTQGLPASQLPVAKLAKPGFNV